MIIPTAVAALPLAGLLTSTVSSFQTRGVAAQCLNQQPSCPTPSNADTCCTNSPGGYFLLTQFWNAQPDIGPVDSWTIHGLWPDKCDGSFDAFCDVNREYSNITQILQSGGGQASLTYMNKYWKDNRGDDEGFWEHEWNKQEVVEYFDRTVSLFKSLPTFQWLTEAGIVPSNTAAYTLAQLQSVARAKFGQNVVWNCQSGKLNEVWYGYTTVGTVTSGSFQPAPVVGGGSTCPSTGIRWLPKSGGMTTTAAPAPTNTAPAGSTPTGKGFLRVTNQGSSNGCLISTGKWMVGVTCAGYTVTNSGSSFTLTTSKGPCQISSSSFICGSGLTPTSFTADSNGNIIHSSSSTFFAQSVPSGNTQVTVLTTTSTQSLKLQFTTS